MGTFTYQGRDFLLNGEKIVLRSGAMHYFRIPRIYWQDRLLKLKECGLNCVETYCCWNLHEPEEGEFHFEDNLDLGAFIDEATKLGLLVIVRPGPYICAEWEGGGLPYWLLKDHNLHIRCAASSYYDKTVPFMRKIMDIVTPRYIGNGGNVIMLQIENEYGSIGSDKEYLKKIKGLYEEYLPECLLFTADWAEPIFLNSGALAEPIACANFGSETEKHLTNMAKLRPNQPLMCMEFWCGWFDAFGQEHHTRKTEEIISELEYFLKNDYSFNIYMFHGGTNFGFMNGANTYSNEEDYHPICSSYDYGAPLSETGDRTELYYAIREAISKKTGTMSALTAKESEKKAYGRVAFTAQADLFENLDNIGETTYSAFPLQMEDLGQAYGYILYQTTPPIEGGISFEKLADRANVFVNGIPKGVCERGGVNTLEPVACENGKYELSVLVENWGRVNYGAFVLDRKGLQNICIFNRRVYGWNCTTLKMNNLDKLCYGKLTEELSVKPTFYKGSVTVDAPADSFLRLDGFKKGFAVVNGFNLGRYYTEKGPQRALYVPKSVLKQGKNEIVVFDTDGTTELNAEFVNVPDLG